MHSRLRHAALFGLFVVLVSISSPAQAEPGEKHWMWGMGLGLMHADPSTEGSSSLFGLHSHSSPTWELTSQTRLGFHIDYLMGGGTRPSRGNQPPQSVFHLTFQMGPTFQYRIGSTLLALNPGYHFGFSTNSSGPQFGVEIGTWREYLTEVRGREQKGEMGGTFWASYGPLISGGWAVMGGTRLYLGR